MKKIMFDVKYDTILALVFITILVLIYSSFAWFSDTLDVEIYEFKIVADDKSDFKISLDGFSWSSEVDIDKSTIITNLNSVYPRHTNQWAPVLGTVSTVGLKRFSDNKFDVFGTTTKTLKEFSFDNTDKINIVKLYEDKSNDESEFLAFDLFIKNYTGSPFSDNLFLGDNTKIGLVEGYTETMALNSLRIGILHYGMVEPDSNISEIQNMTCIGRCSQFIYEPFSTSHSEHSIETLLAHNVPIVNNRAYPTYAVINEGKHVMMWAGIAESGIDFDERHFDYQSTYTDRTKPVAQIGNGIHKFRVYIWIEGQDIDVVQEFSDGYKISMSLEFIKDNAGLR